MAGFEGSVVVARPIEEVFAFLADGENDKTFSKRIIEISKTTDGPVGVGTVYDSKAKDGGITMDHSFELTEFEQPRRIRWKELTKHPVTVKNGGYDLESVDGGTNVRIFNEFEYHGFGKVIGPLASRAAQKGADDFAQAIKAAVEAPPPAPSSG